ncbi:hypothetical protein NQ315_008531 [Exocentrus adspersus]|uniref:Peptidase S1 domain-containing protein n=1 Tax=Exocentrus adspersus TaxID=1586481 RepID=A0AAV8W624_9CUCU|nr:hypothetical protein NQ315_008531 [Exocentrus adspersus]
MYAVEINTHSMNNNKCKEYAKYVWDRSRSPTLSGGGPHYSDTFECPFDKLPLIVGGVYASRQEFPHMVLIGFNKGQEVEWSCGGSLISENYVLTASHCLRSGRMGLAKLIRIGMTNQSDTSHMQELTISEVMYHRDYDFSSKYHDIALMKLSKNVDLNTFARPACLHTGKELPTKRAIATGWGNLGFSAEASNDLMKVVLEFFDHASCNHTYRRKIKRGDSEIKRGILDDLQICAGSHQEPKDTCQGDSGGPLQIYHNDSDGAHCMYDIVGVTSFGKACGLAKNSPGVYVRVSNYIKWIEDVVWPEQS